MAYTCNKGRSPPNLVSSETPDKTCALSLTDSHSKKWSKAALEECMFGPCPHATGAEQKKRLKYSIL